MKVRPKTIKQILVLLLALIFIIQPLSVDAKSKKKKTSKKTSGYTWIKKKNTFYAKDNVVIYEKASTKSARISTYITNDKIKTIARTKNKKWFKVKYNGQTRYIKCTNLSRKKDKSYKYKGPRLTAPMGRNVGPNGLDESWYNLEMSGVISIMRNMGFSESKYPYWIRDDGVKMLGPYIMCGCNLNVHPRGTTVKTSLGTALVCDTGGYALTHPNSCDIAVTW